MIVDILVSGRHGGGLGSCQPGRRLPALGGEVTMMIMIMIMRMMVMMMMTGMMTIACVSKVQNGQRSTWRIPVWGFVKLKLAVDIFVRQCKNQNTQQGQISWNRCDINFLIDFIFLTSGENSNLFPRKRDLEKRIGSVEAEVVNAMINNLSNMHQSPVCTLKSNCDHIHIHIQHMISNWFCSSSIVMALMAGGQGSEGDGSVAVDGGHIQVFWWSWWWQSYHGCLSRLSYLLLWSSPHHHDHNVYRQNPKFGDAAKFQGELEAAILRVQVDDGLDVIDGLDYLDSIDHDNIDDIGSHNQWNENQIDYLYYCYPTPSLRSLWPDIGIRLARPDERTRRSWSKTRSSQAFLASGLLKVSPSSPSRQSER